MTNAINATKENIEAIISAQLTAGVTLTALLPRDGAKPQLGKRYICGQAYQTRDNGGGMNVGYLSGDVGGVNFGCGTTALCTKVPTGESSGPYCCNMPMTQQDPRKLPSSD